MKEFPQEEFDVKLKNPSFSRGDNYLLTFYRINKKIKKTFLFRKEKSVSYKEKLAEFGFTNYSAPRVDSILFYDPAFLRATSQTIDTLNNHFKKHIQIPDPTFDYPIEII